MVRRPKTIEEHKQKDCYGKDRCWNNVRVECPVADSCRDIAVKRAMLMEAGARRH